jgi:hydroxymethylglutaryl-CoA reductase
MDVKDKRSSRLKGFYRHSVSDRQKQVADWIGVDDHQLASGLENGGMDISLADKLVENVIGTYSLPLGIATNFIIDGAEYLIPMVIEEPSVIAAASNAARLARAGGGFTTEADDQIMIGQIQLFCDDPQQAKADIESSSQEILDLAAKVDPKLSAVGGGPRALEVRILPSDDGTSFLVVHLLVDVRDAMGANAVNTMAEAVAPRLEQLVNGNAGLKILSNLADHRLVTACVSIPLHALSEKEMDGEHVGSAIVSAYKFAKADPYRAATHNKGIMNGVDAVVIATGNDWRAVEAGAHSYAARDGVYRPLSTWRLTENGSIEGTLQLPLAMGIVGGAAAIHKGAKTALEILEIESASDLGRIAAAVGLATNFAALRALSTEGIQQGHMRLHNRSRPLSK